MPLTIRERSQKIADQLKTQTQQTIKAVAAATGFSQSSVHRHQQAINRRNQYPESAFWETAAGQAWLLRLVVAVVYHFGIKQGLGAESLSSFFHALHLDTHVGVSASTLRGLKQRVNQGVLDYEAAQSEHCHTPVGSGVCLGGDETFFDVPILVLMELASGYLFAEMACDNRSYNTWLAQLQSWWNPQKWQCHFFVSDGARALLKLAVTGLSSVSVADLFHAMRALGRPMGKAMGRQLAKLQKQFDQLEERVKLSTESSQRQRLTTQIETLAQQQQQVEHDQQTYHEALAQITQTVHPFTLDTSDWQFLTTLTTHLQAPLTTLRELAPSYGGQPAIQAIETFEAQIPSLAHGIQAWWQWTTQALAQETQDTELQNWLLSSLLPWVYWVQQADKTRTDAHRIRYQQAASDAFDALFDQAITTPMSPAELQRWVDWCQWMCSKYQRTSSAIEGRNGYLSQRHHVSRGFSPESLKVLTIIHNFDLRRPDGTTAAQRLFGYEFPDLFEWLLAHVGDLPLPRRSGLAH